MERDAKLMALIYEHFGKVSPEQALQATRFAEAVVQAERERCVAICRGVMQEADRDIGEFASGELCGAERCLAAITGTEFRP